MNAQIKKYIKVALTLGIISGGSALLIGLTNAITKDRIIQNNQNKENNGLAEVFDADNQTFVQGELSEGYDYLQKVWTVSSDSTEIGTIYKASGKNSYGTVTLFFGFDTSDSFTKMVILENTETYGSTLENNYIDKVNGSEIGFEDTTCGATYGAKLIRSMYDEAVEDIKKGA